jgi:hypothetical protein
MIHFPGFGKAYRNVAKACNKTEVNLKGVLARVYICVITSLIPFQKCRSFRSFISSFKLVVLVLHFNKLEYLISNMVPRR